MPALGGILSTDVIAEVTTGSGAPGSAPNAVGDIYVDTTGENVYQAVDTVDSADWVQVNAGGGLGNVVEDVTPQLGADLDVQTFGLFDTNGTALIDFVVDALAVNFIEVENEAAGSGPIIRSTGTDANVPLELDTKGTANVEVLDNLNVTGDITLSGSVDGVDVAALATGQDYTVTNPPAGDRAYDTSGFTLDELGDVVGTLIADLITAGIIT